MGMAEYSKKTPSLSKSLQVWPKANTLICEEKGTLDPEEALLEIY
jgi:hypothetical protein